MSATTTTYPISLAEDSINTAETMMTEAMGRMLLDDDPLEVVQETEVLPKVDFWRLLER